MTTIKKGLKLSAPKDILVHNTELRYGEENRETNILHSGQFIVEGVGSGNVELADAEFNVDGVVTFHSNKHGHAVLTRDLRDMIRMGMIIVFG